LIAALDGQDAAVLLHGVWLALVVEIGLRVRPLGALLDWCETPRSASRSATPDVDRIARLASWPFRVLPVPSTCLRRSLVLTALLNRRGVASHVLLGVCKRDAGLEAHAWVEHARRPVGEGPGARFEPLPRAALGRITRSVRWQP
jgi:hypothetical protein